MSAKSALEDARGQVVTLLGGGADEVVLTSGGSEANNLALKGVFFCAQGQGRAYRHERGRDPAILGPCRFLERLGATVSYLPVDGTGRVDPDAVRCAITPCTILISIMHANNEVGTIQPIAEIGRIARERDIIFHTNAAQFIGKIPTNVGALGVDLLTIAGHKLYGPRASAPSMSSEASRSSRSSMARGMRVAGALAPRESCSLLALAAACALASDLTPMERICALRDRF